MISGVVNSNPAHASLKGVVLKSQELSKIGHYPKSLGKLFKLTAVSHFIHKGNNCTMT